MKFCLQNLGNRRKDENGSRKTNYRFKDKNKCSDILLWAITKVNFVIK